MSKKRIVVTGMGVVSCFGNDVQEFYNSLLEGKSGVSLIKNFDVENFPTRFAASIEKFETGDYMERKQARRADPYMHYAMVAGKKALESAQLGDKKSLDALDKERAGVMISSGMGGMQAYADGVTSFLEKGLRRLSPFFVPHIITNMAGALLAMDLKFMGPNYSISTACATSNFSIVSAADHLRKGDADLIITGGTEAAIMSMGLSGFCACKALSQRNEAPEKASRPWDQNRDGFVMGEGAGVIVLETLEHALKRGAPIIAEYMGGGISCDAHHMTEPHPEGKGVALAIKNALKDADMSAERINYINAHATSTLVGDMAEVYATKKAIKDPSKVAMNATKSMIGHCLGAAGGIEAIATLMAIKTGEIHPTINLENPEPDLEFFTPTKRTKLSIDAALSNSFGFGGHNASIIFAPYKK